MLWHKIAGAAGFGGELIYDWEFINPQIDSETSFATDTTFPHSVTVSDNGQWLFIGDYNTGDMLTYELSTPFDVSSAGSLVRRTSLVGGNNTVGGHFTRDGLIFFFANNSNDTIQKYTLTTAWNLSTISLDSTYSNGTYITNAQKVFVDETGGHMYVSGGTGQNIEHFILSIPFDITSASHSDTGPSTSGNGVAVNNDGTKLFASDNGTDDLQIYSQSTPYDASTATLSSSIDLSGTTGSLNSGDITRDGVWAYGGSNTGDKIIQVEVQT